VTLEYFITVAVNTSVFWDVTPGSLAFTRDSNWPASSTLYH